ncbi:serine-rich adhesin for platelets isoform X1 [Eurosta solidaginis]|uniref:serine-rich adhesin for platelets isoform X1 n=1 Tax=Eurosta solidaginis TaxID=178769 RepID=UPI0035305CA9
MFATISGCVKAGVSGGSGMLLVGEEKRLDAMNAVCVYVSTAQLVLQSAVQTEGISNNLGEQRILDLTRLFGQLRQLLSCAVCARLLNDPYAPLNNARCQHNVCRLCVRGRKALRPLCISCKDLQDFKTYVENKTMRCLLLCYKSLCEHLLGSNFYAQLSRQKAHQALTCSGENVFGVAPMPHMTTCGDIIQEGARYDDILNVFSLDLPQITPVIGRTQQTQQQLQPLVPLSAPAAVGGSIATQTSTLTPSLSISAITPLAPLSAPGKRIHAPTAPRLITTPPAKSPASAAVHNTTTLLKTPPAPHGTIIKLEPTNTHLTAAHGGNTHIVMTSKVASLQPQQQQTQFVYVKNLKSAVSETSAYQQQQQHTSQLNSVQSSALNNTNNIGLPTLSSAPTITYVGNNTPGIVVPIVSSSGTTAAPLTIASAKLQSLKRQLAQAQARGGAPISLASAVKAAGLTYTETNTPQTSFKMSTSAPALVGTSNSVTITASTSTPILVNSSNITYVSASGTTSHTPTSSTVSITSQQQQVRNPPSIKTVSNGSAMYSVLYTGVGNKITIKRKTDGDDESGQRKSIATSISASSSTPAPLTPAATTNNPAVITNQQQLQQQVNANKINAAKRRGCRCGNATPTPGKLTCCGQRCPCYVDSKSCIGCKCRGCRNPHRPDGGKVRPVIPELACYEIQMADENPSLSPSDLQVANTLTTRTHTISASTTTSPLQLAAQQPGTMLVSEQHGTSAGTSLSLSSLSSSSSSTSSVTGLSSQLHLAPSSSSSSPSSKGATLIPFISLHPITSQQEQQQTQTISTISSNQQQQQQQQSNILPLESVLIQNAEGKYQVVNVLTTTTPHHHQQHNSSSSSIKRIHSIPHLQISTSASNNNNNSSSSNNSNANHTSLVGNLTTVNIITGTTASNAASSSTIVTSKGAGQNILLTQQQHVNRLQQQLQQKSYQQHQIQRLISSDIITTSAKANTATTVVSNSSIQMQLHQQHQNQNQHRQHHQQQQEQQHHQQQLHHHTQNTQLKSNQFITMRSATMQNNSNSNNNNTSSHQTQTFTPTLFTSNASNATTITLSPIIMSSSSPNAFKAELFSDSSDSDFMNLATSASALTSASSANNTNNNNTSIHANMLSTIYSHSGLVSTSNTPARITSVPSLSSGSTGSASGSTSRMSLGGMSMSLTSAGSHLTPALVEVIEASDL